MRNQGYDDMMRLSRLVVPAMLADAIREIARLEGTDVRDAMDYYTILGLKKVVPGKLRELQAQGAAARTYRPIDWSAAYRPSPAPARIDFAGELAARERRQ